MVLRGKSITFASTISATPLYNAYQGGTYFLYTYDNIHQESISISDQMAMLKSRGLLFEDEQTAIECLKIISYFRLANYWKPMESDKVNHVFKPKSRFENVVALYNFDKELRTLIFSAIQSIEIALRTKVIQIVSSNYGAFWFANETLFSNTTIFSKCLS